MTASGSKSLASKDAVPAFSRFFKNIPVVLESRAKSTYIFWPPYTYHNPAGKIKQECFAAEIVATIDVSIFDTANQLCPARQQQKQE